MNEDALISQMADWIGEITEQAPPSLSRDTDLVQDMGLDSLVLAELGAKLRSRYKIKLRPGELRQDLRVGAVVDFVLARIPT